jgi:hypothetical protein
MKVLINNTPRSRLPFEKAAGLIVLSVILMVSFFCTPEDGPGFTLCLFKNLFGIDCPGCGMGRAFMALGHGEIAMALRMNLMSPVAFLLALVLWAKGLTALAFRKEVGILLGGKERKLLAALAFSIALSFWI